MRKVLMLLLLSLLTPTVASAQSTDPPTTIDIAEYHEQFQELLPRFRQAVRTQAPHYLWQVTIEVLEEYRRFTDDWIQGRHHGPSRVNTFRRRVSNLLADAERLVSAVEIGPQYEVTAGTRNLIDSLGFDPESYVSNNEHRDDLYVRLMCAYLAARECAADAQLVREIDELHHSAIDALQGSWESFFIAARWDPGLVRLHTAEIFLDVAGDDVRQLERWASLLRHGVDPRSDEAARVTLEPFEGDITFVRVFYLAQVDQLEITDRQRFLMEVDQAVEDATNRE